MDISKNVVAGFYCGKNVIKSIALVVIISLIKNTAACFSNDIYFLALLYDFQRNLCLVCYELFVFAPKLFNVYFQKLVRK